MTDSNAREGGAWEWHQDYDYRRNPFGYAMLSGTSTMTLLLSSLYKETIF